MVTTRPLPVATVKETCNQLREELAVALVKSRQRRWSRRGDVCQCDIWTNYSHRDVSEVCRGGSGYGTLEEPESLHLDPGKTSFCPESSSSGEVYWSLQVALMSIQLSITCKHIKTLNRHIIESTL